MKLTNILRVILWLIAVITLGLFVFDKIGLTTFVIIYLVFIVGIIYLDVVIKRNKE